MYFTCTSLDATFPDSSRVTWSRNLCLTGWINWHCQTTKCSILPPIVSPLQTTFIDIHHLLRKDIPITHQLAIPLCVIPRSHVICSLTSFQESSNVEQSPRGSWGFHSNTPISSLDSSCTLEQEICRLCQTITDISHHHDLLSAQHETLKWVLFLNLSSLLLWHGKLSGSHFMPFWSEFPR
jgi:hypothetical protein